MENKTITGTHRGYSAIYKAKIALLALKEEGDLSHLAARFKINEALIRCWKEELLENLKESAVESQKTLDSYVDPKDVYLQDLEGVKTFIRKTPLANDDSCQDSTFKDTSPKSTQREQ